MSYNLVPRAYRKMASGLLFATLFFLPCLASCAFPWPDNVTQHKGYIEVCEKVQCTKMALQSTEALPIILRHLPIICTRFILDKRMHARVSGSYQIHSTSWQCPK